LKAVSEDSNNKRGKQNAERKNAAPGLMSLNREDRFQGEGYRSNEPGKVHDDTEGKAAEENGRI